MQVLKFGTIIETKIGNIKGIITAAIVRDKYVSYEASYFISSGEHKVVTLDETEFIVSNGKKETIGFKS